MASAGLVVPGAAGGSRLDPASSRPPSWKWAWVVGVLRAAVAVKVTLVPTVDGFSELLNRVVVGTGLTALTTCDSAALAEAALPASPA